MATVGLAIIAKNEAERLPTLLGSIVGAFDQVVLLDTGSVDRTVAVVRAWAKKHDENLTVGKFKWCDDFAAARNHAEGLLETDWHAWADCDDVIVNAGMLRQIAANAPQEVAALMFDYDYAQHPETGMCVCTLRRERLVRAGKGNWINRVHEAQIMDGPIQMVPPELVYWKHQKTANDPVAAAGSNERNLRILKAWVQDEPENTRVLAYLGSETCATGDLDTAKAYFMRYLDLEPDWTEERAQVHRKLAMVYLMQDQPDFAIHTAMAALRVLPSWTDSYISLAEAYHYKGEHDKAIEWAKMALERGAPQGTMLILNPLDYTVQPRKVMAGSFGSLGRIDEAIQAARKALDIDPTDMALRQALFGWQATAKREHTANTVVMLAQQLVAHDEQLKALDLLERSVPHFAQDHPAVVNARSQLRERLSWLTNQDTFQDHYATGGSKPEDFLPEDQVDEVCKRLPRVFFLMEGLVEQAREQAISAAIDRDLPSMLEAAGLA